MNETRASYLNRVQPDLDEIRLLVEEAMSKPPEVAPFHLSCAITRTQKLLEDLKRAEQAS